MAHEIIGSAITRLHALGAVVSVRTHFLAASAGPAPRTVAGAVRSSTRRVLIAVAHLQTVHSVAAWRAGSVTPFTTPARIAHTLTRNNITFRLASAVALLLTHDAVSSVRTRFAAESASEAGRTGTCSGHRITGTTSVGTGRTFLQAAGTESARDTGCRAIITLPSGRAGAETCFWIAGRVVFTVAPFFTLWSIATVSTLRFTAYTVPSGQADTPASNWITASAGVLITRAAQLTIESGSELGA